MGHRARMLIPVWLLGAILGAAAPALASSNVDAAKIVELYYVFQGSEPSAVRLTSGIPAAKELLDFGFARASLEQALVQCFREEQAAARGAFEDVFPDWLLDHADAFGGRALSLPRDDRREPAAAPPEPEPEPEPTRDDVDEEMPDILVDDESEAVETSWVIEDEEPDESAPPPKPERPDRAERLAKVTVERPRGVTRKQRTGLIVAGSCLLLGGMGGGAAAGAAMGYSSNFYPGGVALIGAIPLAGPGASHNYWLNWGDYWATLDYTPLVVTLTAVEIAGVALIVIGAAAPKRDAVSQDRALRRSDAPSFTVIPSVSPGSAKLSLVGRF